MAYELVKFEPQVLRNQQMGLYSEQFLKMNLRVKNGDVHLRVCTYKFCEILKITRCSLVRKDPAHRVTHGQDDFLKKTITT